MTPLLLLALAAFAFIAWQDHRRAFFLFLGLLPTYLIRFNFGGFPTTALELLFVILLIAWLMRREKRLVDIRGWGILMILWLAAATAAVFVSPNTRAAFGVWKAYFVEPAIFFILANDVLRSAENRARAVAALAWTALVIGVLAVFQRFTNFAVPYPWNVTGEFRATAFYGFPNAIGLFLAPLVPLFAWQAGHDLLGSDRNRRRGLLTAVAAVASLVAIVLAQSEGAVVGAVAGLVLLGLTIKKIRKPFVAGLATLVVVIALISTARNYAVEKLTFQDWSGRVRTEMWGEAWNMLKEHAVLGAGLSGYPTVFDAYHKARHIEIFQYPHQIVLNFWSELGLFGVVLLLWTLWLVVRSRQWPLVAAFVALVVHGLVDVPYFKNDLSFLWWLLLAMIASSQAERLPSKKS